MLTNSRPNQVLEFLHCYIQHYLKPTTGTLLLIRLLGRLLAELTTSFEDTSPVIRFGEAADAQCCVYGETHTCSGITPSKDGFEPSF